MPALCDLAAGPPEIIDRIWLFVGDSRTEPVDPKFRMEIPQRP